MGTAGSIPLVLQALIPVAAASGRRLRMRLRGGTDVPWSPTADYARLVLGAAYARMGAGFSVDVRRRGYYPGGGGSVTLEVSGRRPGPASFSGRIRRAMVVCAYSGVSAGEIESGVGMARDALSGAGISSDADVVCQEAAGPGASILAYGAEGGCVAGADALYDAKARRFGLDTGRLAGAPGVDENLADMLVVPASVAGARTTFRTRRITGHLETVLYVASRMTGCRYGIGRVDGGYEVIVQSRAGVKEGGKEQYGD